HQYSHMLSRCAFVGIHTGHLGFYADWLPHEVEKLIIEINNSEFQVIEYPLLEIIVRYNDNGYETRYLALNEATMKTENGSTLVVDVNIEETNLNALEEMDCVCQHHQVLLHIIRRW